MPRLSSDDTSVHTLVLSNSRPFTMFSIALGCVGVLVAVIAALIAWIRPWKLLPPSTGTLPCVPASSSLMGCGTELGRAFANGSIELLLFRWLKDFGGSRFVAIQAPGQLMVFVNDPDVSRVVNNERTFLATNGTIDTFSTYARGLIALEGDVWAVHRRAVTRAFYPENLRLVAGAADNIISAWLKSLAHNAPHATPIQWDAQQTFLALYLDVMGRAMLSTDFGGLVRARDLNSRASDPAHAAAPSSVLDSFSVVFKTISKLTGIPKALWGVLMPASEMANYKVATGLIRKLASRLTEDRVAARALRQTKTAIASDDAGATRDFLDIMLDETDSATLSMSEVIDELMIMLVAATETTAVTTGWMLYALARDAAGAPTPAIYEGLFEFDPATLITRTPVDARGRIAETDASLSIPDAAASSWRRSLKDILAAKANGDGSGGDLWERLTAEISEVVGSIDPSAPLRYEHLDKLVLCEGVIKECVGAEIR